MNIFKRIGLMTWRDNNKIVPFNIGCHIYSEEGEDVLYIELFFICLWIILSATIVPKERMISE